ncbi:helix-turn-helix domain-containing protein [Sneathiella aquimaris]|uniref:helix-turn-helix domain-containing protein n=1 Tax=Sneathiella aquimaris TaxID=2599305 RepID=UPI00146CBC02|nr:helix-turn-helix transcriptional regulator [Sneathiella aquimaris]
MDKRQTAILFRKRLGEAILQSGLSKSALADKAGLDRSAISQMLKEDSTTLPNGHSLALLCQALNISSDWLLGLADDPRPSSQVLEQAVELTPSQRWHPLDKNIIRWHMEALGHKIRYIPSSLPTPMKTSAVINYEFDIHPSKTADQAQIITDEQLSFFRRPESELEVALSQQTLQDFAEGNGVWRGLDIKDRLEQIEKLSDYCRELYPGVRLHLYDGRSFYSSPILVFGHMRAALYLGQRYFVFPKGERVFALIRHFDELVRGACVTSDNTARWLENLAIETKKNSA